MEMVFTESGVDGEHTFVLVHGIGMGRIVFAGVAEILAEHGRVYAIDLPGFGDSPEPGSAHSIETTADLVARFISDESLRNVVLVGHSMGTQVVAEVAARRPELVAKLVLIAPTVNRHERTATLQAARMMQDLSGESPKVIALGMVEYAKTSPLWFTRKLAIMLDHHLEDLCPRVSVDTLVLRGETDRVCPREWVSEIADALPHSTMREIEGRGHEAVIKSPEPVASMILEHAASSTR